MTLTATAAAAGYQVRVGDPAVVLAHRPARRPSRRTTQVSIGILMMLVVSTSTADTIAATGERWLCHILIVIIRVLLRREHLLGIPFSRWLGQGPLLLLIESSHIYVLSLGRVGDGIPLSMSTTRMIDHLQWGHYS